MLALTLSAAGGDAAHGGGTAAMALTATATRHGARTATPRTRRHAAPLRTTH